jgi:hypothetical protein
LKPCTARKMSSISSRDRPAVSGCGEMELVVKFACCFWGDEGRK